jgi:hypothetical protein
MKLGTAKMTILGFLALTPKLTSTPTEIGGACGKAYRNASSWACRHLRWLKRWGLVRQLGGLGGPYKVTAQGQRVFCDHKPADLRVTPEEKKRIAGLFTDGLDKAAANPEKYWKD